MNHLTNFVALLDDLAVIEISGPDAAPFLHGQLTHDITGMASDQARLNGYCTAKGRLLGSMVIWSAQKDDATVLYALVKADIASALIKRLSMFVLRAKLALQMSSSQVLGVSLTKSETIDDLPSMDLIRQAAIISAQQNTWDVVRNAAGTWISAPSADVDTARWWFVEADAKQQRGQHDATTRPGMPAAGRAAPFPSSDCWRAGDIAAGLPWVDAATQDLFIPQTLNLDLIDGVSFSKGCYPGQEVVARSHYRGTVKRRMAYGVVTGAGDIDALKLAGTDIYKAGNPDTPCGRIVNAAACGPVHLSMEVQLSDLPTLDFRLGRAEGPAIELRPLPYKIKTDS